MNNMENLYSEFIKQHPCIHYADGSNSIYFQLTSAIGGYYTYLYSVEKKENSFKLYPTTVTDEEIENFYYQDLRELFLECIQKRIPIENLITNKVKEYEKRIKEIKDYLFSTPMEPYYGPPEFMFDHANYILECMKKLPVETPDLSKAFEDMQFFMKKYGGITNNWRQTIYPFHSEEYRKDYQKFEKSYYGILEVEKALSKEAENVWKSTLTDPREHNDKSFKYLIHVFTSGMIPLENMGKVCCSYATENLLTPPYGDTGIICDFDSEAVESMCSEDAGSWVVTKRQFLERFAISRWQLPTPEEKSSVWFEATNISKLLLPNDMERDAIAHNLSVNGEFLNYTKMPCYSEIFLNSKARVIGAFYTDDCKDIGPIQEYASKYHLPLVHLSLQKLRENAGLPPLEEKKEEANYHY